MTDVAHEADLRGLYDDFESAHLIHHPVGGHHHAGDRAMAWLDGLDIPLVQRGRVATGSVHLQRPSHLRVPEPGPPGDPGGRFPVKLATIRTASGSAAVRTEDHGAVDVGFPGQLGNSCVERAESR